MVVISAAILSKSKTLLSRQFVEMSRLRIEGLLSAFLRLLDSGSKDYTYIETDSVRYVYLPITSLYLVLITNKQSNILEDLETLKLMQQVVQQCCESSVDEDNVLTKAFDIVFAFDEVISFGYRESVTLAQIKAFTEMDSQDEKMSLLVLQEKIKEEKKRAQRIATRLDKERKEQAKLEAERASKHAISSFASAAASAVSALSSQHSAAPREVIPSFVSTVDSAIGSQITVGSGGGGPQRGMKLGKAKPPTAELLSALRLNQGVE